MKLLIFFVVIIHFVYGEDTSETSSNIPSNTPASSEIYRLGYEIIDDKRYEIHKLPTNWYQAHMTCLLKGGELYKPADEKDFSKLKNVNSSKAYWTGFNDIYTKNIFLDMKDLNWKEKEPNHAAVNENCILIKDGLIQDEKCTRKNPFVCVRDEKITKNEYCDTFAKGYEINNDLDVCYKLHRIPATWGNAVFICNTEDSMLTVINSQTEASHLNKLMGSDLKSIHIGYSELATPGFYLTIDDKSLSEAGYQKFNPELVAEMGLDDEAKCGSYDKEGYYVNIPCDKKLPFVCETNGIKKNNHDKTKDDNED